MLRDRSGHGLQLVTDADHGLRYRQDPGDVDGRGGQHNVGRDRLEGRLQLVNLLVAIPHGREQSLQLGVLGEGLGELAGRVGARIHDLGRPEALRRDHRGTVGHLAVGQRGPVLDAQHALAGNGLGVIDRDLGVAVHHDGLGD